MTLFREAFPTVTNMVRVAKMVKVDNMADVHLGKQGRGMPYPPCENESCFSRFRSKIPSRFPAAQNRAAHKAASRFFSSVGGQA